MHALLMWFDVEKEHIFMCDISLTINSASIFDIHVYETVREGWLGKQYMNPICD